MLTSNISTQQFTELIFRLTIDVIPHAKQTEFTDKEFIMFFTVINQGILYHSTLMYMSVVFQELSLLLGHAKAQSPAVKTRNPRIRAR